MITRFKFFGLAALLFAGVLPAFNTSAAIATATAQVISPTEVLIVTAAELLKSASTGVLTLSIPGGGATGTGDGTGAEMTLTSTGVNGNTIAFSTPDSASLTSLIQTLAASGGSIGMNGILSTGQVVSLFVTHAEQVTMEKARCMLLSRTTEEPGFRLLASGTIYCTIISKV